MIALTRLRRAADHTELCNVEVLKYGGPHDYVFLNQLLNLPEVSQVRQLTWPLWYFSYVSRFRPISSHFCQISATNRTTYQPTDEERLMRDVVAPGFRKVCIGELCPTY